MKITLPQLRRIIKEEIGSRPRRKKMTPEEYSEMVRTANQREKDADAGARKARYDELKARYPKLAAKVPFEVWDAELASRNEGARGGGSRGLGEAGILHLFLELLEGK